MSDSLFLRLILLVTLLSCLHGCVWNVVFNRFVTNHDVHVVLGWDTATVGESERPEIDLVHLVGISRLNLTFPCLVP